MAYSTGTANDAPALKAAIETFAQANGWTLTGGTLSKSASYIQLTTTGTDSVIVWGSNEPTFTTGKAPEGARLYHATWPVTYHLFAHGNDVYCVASPDNAYFAYLAWGELTKYGTWAGGNWFGASMNRVPYAGGTAGLTPPKVFAFPTANPLPGDIGYIYSEQYHPSGHAGGGALFCTGYSYLPTYPKYGHSYLHAEIDGTVWRSQFGASAESVLGHFQAVTSLLLRQPNVWNGQAVLVPYYVWMPRPASMSSIVGEVPYIRSLRIDNLSPGDIITLGADKWKVFPWVQKDAADRNNTAQTDGKSGTFGWAIKYDGP